MTYIEHDAEQRTGRSKGTARASRIAYWDRVLLFGVSMLTVVSAFFTLSVYNGQDETACKGANEAKQAVSKVVQGLYNQSLQHSDDPGIEAARQASRLQYKILVQELSKDLAPREC